MSPSGASRPRPSVGRMVHYVSHGTPIRDDGTRAYDPQCRAAVVTEVDPDDADRVGLAVLNPTGQFFHPLAAGGCRHHAADEQPAGATWHWPEVV